LLAPSIKPTAFSWTPGIHIGSEIPLLTPTSVTVQVMLSRGSERRGPTEKRVSYINQTKEVTEYYFLLYPASFLMLQSKTVNKYIYYIYYINKSPDIFF
jgi:hypothetical protein